MTDPNALAGYRRALARRGVPLTVRRIIGEAPNATTFDATVTALVMDYVPKAPVADVRPEGEITLGARNVIVLADDLAAASFPLLGLLSTSGNFTLGNVTSLAGIKDDTRVLQTSTPVQPGNSGGPLLDMSGSIVGVIESQLNALAMIKVTSDVPQNVNFAIQTPIVINFLSIKGVSPSVAGNERKILDPADVANLAKDFTVQVVCQPTAN